MLTLLLLIIALSSVVYCVDMRDSEYDLLYDFLDDAGVSNSNLKNKYDLEGKPHQNCNRFSINSFRPIKCSSLGYVEELWFVNGFGSFDTFDANNLKKLTRLKRIVWDSSMQGAFPPNKLAPALTDLTVVDGSFRDVLPDWVWELDSFQLQDPMFLDPDRLPENRTVVPASCQLPNNYFRCPHPDWAIMSCGLSNTTCQPPTPAPTPMPPTPVPTTNAPTPAPTFAGNGMPDAFLSPCPSLVNETVHPDCAGKTCMWACALFSCDTSYSSYPNDLSSSYSCAQVLGPANCGDSYSDCSDAWAPSGALPNLANQEMVVGFQEAINLEKLIVYENYYPGFMTGVEAWINDGWVTIYTGLEANRTSSTSVRKADFDLTQMGTFNSDRIKLIMAITSYNDEIDAILVIGNNVPTPMPAPSPTVPPTPQPTPNPFLNCEPAVSLGRNSNPDITIGDLYCVDTTCQWACVVNNCSSQYSNTYACNNALGSDINTIWNAGANDLNLTLDVSFEFLANATGLVVIEQKVGTGLEKIELWSESEQKFNEAWSGEVANVGNDGAEYYLLDFDVASKELSRRVKLYFGGFRYHDIAAIRLVGAVAGMTIPNNPGRPLDGIFAKDTFSLTQPRQMTNVEYGPAAVLNDTVYVAPGYKQGSGFFLTYAENVDRCDLSQKKCFDYTGTLPTSTERFVEPTTAALDVKGTPVLMMYGGRLDTGSRYPTRTFFYRTPTTDWAALNRAQSSDARHEGCMVAVPWETSIYYAGGRRTAFNERNSIATTNMIEKITFPDLPTSPQIETLRATLSQDRAQVGCALVGPGSDVIMFAGGWFSVTDGYNATDVVEFFNTRTNAVKVSKLSYKTVGPTIAGISTLVLVTGGSKYVGPPTFGSDAVGGFSYDDYAELGVDRYDFDLDQWTYIPDVLTRLLYNVEGRVPMRVAVPFGNRFIAVVAGQTLFQHDGSLEMARVNASSHRRPIDIYDAQSNTWYNDLLQHHAGTGFLVAGTDKSLVIAGGAHTSESVFEHHDTVTMFTFRKHNYTLIECSDSLNNECYDCLVDNAYRQVEPCRFCYDESTGRGNCQKQLSVCTNGKKSLVVGQGACPVVQTTTTFSTTSLTTTPVSTTVDPSATSTVSGTGSITAQTPAPDVTSTASVASTSTGVPTTTTNVAPAPDTTASLEGETASPTVSVSEPTTDTNINIMPPGAQVGDSSPTDTPLLAIILGVLGACCCCILLVGLIIGFLLMRRKRDRAQSVASDPLNDDRGRTATAATDYGIASAAGSDRLYDQTGDYGVAPPATGTFDIASNAARLSNSHRTLASTTEIDTKYLIKAKDIERESKLGEGAFGVVYKARWRNIAVAVKEVKPEALSDVSQIQSFEREAVQMSKLRPHDHVITLYGVCQDPLSIVTEFATGGGLDEWLKKHHADASDKQLMSITLGAARGVAHLHAEGIVHRDLAARNILLGDNDKPKVSDFGMSRVDEGEDANETRTRVGPLKWMGPEQMLHQQYSKMSDVFAFGVLMYEIFAGKEPWEGLANTAACHKVLSGERLPAPSRMPSAVAELMSLCFLAEPEKRPTMDDCCRRLERAYSSMPDSPTPKPTEIKGKNDDDDNDAFDDSDDVAYPASRVDESLTYSLPPGPATLDEDGYGLAPVVSTRENESIRKAGGVPESTYDEPAALPGADDSSDTSDINGIDEAGGAYDEPMPMSAVKKLTKEEQKQWRLSKKYEPKVEPPSTNVSMRADDAPLPDGWRSAVSPKSGRTYYYRRGTNVTQWHRPTE